jgi:hypothetical protein
MRHSALQQTTLSIKGRYAELRLCFMSAYIAMLGVVILNVVMLSVVVPHILISNGRFMIMTQTLERCNFLYNCFFFQFKKVKNNPYIYK